MPLTGPVALEDVSKDLLRAMQALDPSTNLLVVGMALRDEAIAFVNAGWAAAKWIEWRDYYKLIEEQDGHGEALEEGLEAYREEECFPDTESEPNLDAGDESDGPTAAGQVGSQPRTHVRMETLSTPGIMMFVVRAMLKAMAGLLEP